jgi:hypothetical protein
LVKKIIGFFFLNDVDCWLSIVVIENCCSHGDKFSKLERDLLKNLKKNNNS